jgi:CPA1 family monovalent cation:H+ antiporter
LSAAVSIAFPLNSIGLLLIVAAIMAMLTRRVGLPYSTGLVAAGILVSFMPNRPQLPLTRELIFDVLLPPLVFEAALQLDWKRFRHELPLTLTLAFIGVIGASAFVTVGMHWLLGWSWLGAALFGVLIAATDPVAVIATFKELKGPKRLTMVVESESLLNDGVAAVAFAVLAAIASGAAPSAGQVIPQFLWSIFGGILIGGGVAGAVLLVAGRTEDRLVEITLTTIAAWGSFLLAEHYGGSGILASLTAGLMIGNVGWVGAISDSGRPHILAAWDYFAYLATSYVFLLIGIHETRIPLNVLGWAEAAIAILLVLIGRLITVYPIVGAFGASNLRLPLNYQHVLFWGGLRGALALALALAVPNSVPEKVAIIVTAFLVVSFSVFVQGLTIPWFARRLGLVGGGEEDQAPQPAV